MIVKTARSSLLVIILDICPVHQDWAALLGCLDSPEYLEGQVFLVHQARQVEEVGLLRILSITLSLEVIL